MRCTTVLIVLILIPLLLVSFSCATTQRMLGRGQTQSVTIAEGPEDDELSELLGESTGRRQDDGDDIDALLSGETSDQRTLTPPPIQEDRYRVITDKARLRSGPSTSSGVIAVLAKGTQLKMLDWEGNWVRVVDDLGHQGYMHVTLIEKDDGESTAPAMIPYSSTNEPEVTFPSSRRLVVTKGSNIRRGPDTSYNPPIMCAPAGTEFIASGKTGQWYYGTCRGVNGWIYGTLVSESYDATASMDSGAGLGDLETGNTYTTSSSTVRSTAEGRSTAATPGQSGQAPSTPMIAGAQPVSARSSPSMLSQVTGTLNPGQKVSIIDSRSGWRKVKAGRLEGWIPASSLVGETE